MTAPPRFSSVLPPPEVLARTRRWRLFKDHLARYGMGIGGVSVIIAVVLIFFYLFYVVVPMFQPAHAKAAAQYAVPAPELGKTLHLAMEEQNEVAVRFTDLGYAVFYSPADGSVRQTVKLPIGAGRKVTSFAKGDLTKEVVAFGLDNGQVLVARHEYDVTYPENRRLITPKITFPLGEKAISLDPRRHAVTALAVQAASGSGTVVGYTNDERLLLNKFAKEESLLGDEASLTETRATIPLETRPIQLLISPEQRTLYVREQTGELTSVDISDPAQPTIHEQVRIGNTDNPATTAQFLLGGISLLIGHRDGRVDQWFPVRDENNVTRLKQIRSFPGDQRVDRVTPEQRRKGFAVGTDRGQVTIYHATARRKLLDIDVSKQAIERLALSPRANALLAEDQVGRQHFWRIENEHPEVSWSVLWDRVWYESYSEPEYTWQSSAATNDFEPKFSLMPLTFGTLKAAFYAMLFAIPLAILGAIYTAYFMAPKMRALVKPAVEIMEALPTVILGFLAGLWLAPLIEEQLAGVFMALFLLPIGTLGFALLWQYLPKSLRTLVPDGWHAALLIPVLLAVCWFAFAISDPIENALFGGSLSAWFTTHLGIGYDQRNALVVGIAMGIAVIPTIFSIAEDAVFSVPKHLTFGSLALGATPWQTVARVVLLTASPGIFSAVMIGLGRAVGETMIVLMATGNTAVMDWSIFQGMRTLSANIAVEMPESEVASTHYRILFLAALVLFMFTFILNTAAEIVRQRLRRKYSSL